MDQMDREQHWQKIHSQKKDSQASWYESYPAVSLKLIEKACPAS